MAAPDMDVIKDIPGYKVILKAILKSQIQQLVEQLACHTDEESVLLTASVSDGTLCHLGSDSGKVFLEDHEDIKSQFLGFCLKRHHRRKQDKEREQEQQQQRELQQQQQQQQQSFPNARLMPYSGIAPRGFAPRSHRPHYPRHSTPRHSIRAGPGVRHEPYPMSRPIKVNSLDASDVIQSGNQARTVGVDPTLDVRRTVKLESVDPSQDGSDIDVRMSNLDQSGVTHHLQERDDEQSNSSAASTIPNEGNESRGENMSGLGLDSDFSTLIKANSNHGNTDALSMQQPSTPQSSSHDSAPHTPTAVAIATTGSGLDPNVSVKMEESGEDDLEITGVEMGGGDMSADQMGGSQDDGWAQGIPPGLGFDPATGAMVGQPDGAGGQSYMFAGAGVSATSASWNRVSSSTPGTLTDATDQRFSCHLCTKTFSRNTNLTQHLKIHSGERPFCCPYCGRSFNRNSHLKCHLTTHLNANSLPF